MAAGREAVGKGWKEFGGQGYTVLGGSWWCTGLVEIVGSG